MQTDDAGAMTAGTELWQVTNARFCAGIVTVHGVVVQTATIVRWMRGKTLDDLRSLPLLKLERVPLPEHSGRDCPPDTGRAPSLAD